MFRRAWASIYRAETPIASVSSSSFWLGKKMGCESESTLRSLVEKWLGPVSTAPVRITRSGRTQSHQGVYVHIELLLQRGTVGLFFFRHPDGSWRVFPPEAARPVMRVH